MKDEARFQGALARIDAVNAEDPRTEETPEGLVPRELLYGRRMSDRLATFAPDASEPLRLAVRAQHIARWKVPRTDFPEGRRGYKAWRSHLMGMHAEWVGEILRDVGYGEDVVERVSSLVRKQALRRDPEAQTLEDVACLVFLEHYFAAFAEDHGEDKVVDILRKTWGKMSERGREAAVALDPGARGRALLALALADPA